MGYRIKGRDVVLHPIQTAVRHGTEPAYDGVAFDAESYLNKTPRYKVVKKFLHKYLALFLNRQLPLLRSKIEANRRVLVLYTGKDSLGDANLELCGRALLRERGISIDLLTLPKLAPQFKEDDVFCRIFTSIGEIDAGAYDVVLLAEFNHRSLKLKNRYFKQTPFACLFGFFDGPARNQAHFSYAAFNDLFGLGLNSGNIDQLAKPYLHCTSATLHSVIPLLPNEPYVAISIGGVDPYRTYRNWGELLGLLDRAVGTTRLQHVVLVGSANGEADAQTLLKKTFNNLNLRSMVGQLNLLQTRSVIDKSRLFVGCDGGLMHVAHSTETPTVTLFSSKEPYQYWLTPACKSTPIQSSGGASDISANAVMASLLTAMKL